MLSAIAFPPTAVYCEACHDVTAHWDQSNGWGAGGEGGGSGSLFITGPPAMLLMYGTRCSIRAGGASRAQFRNWQVHGIIASIKVSTIKTPNSTNPPSIKVTHD